MPEANLARLGPAVVVVASRDCPDAPGADKPEANCTVAMPCDRVGTPGRLRGGGIVAETAPYTPEADCAAVAPYRWPCDYPMSLRTASHSLDTGNGTLLSGKISPKCILRGPRTAKRRFPGKIFAGCIPQQRFSPLFTAQIIHNELILPKTGRSSMHFSDILP